MQGLAIKKGFSLVELVIAIGIFSFATVAIIGLIPVGLNIFQKSSTSVAQTLISRNLSREIWQTDYSSILTNRPNFVKMFPRYYDHEGMQVDLPQNAFYQVPYPIKVVAPSMGGDSISNVLSLEFRVLSLRQKRSQESPLTTILVSDNGR